MKGIGGNTAAFIQVRKATTNSIGEQELVWLDVQQLRGWLDLMTGSTNSSAYSTRMQDSTHIFVCDYVLLHPAVSPENARMIINGKRYSINLIDNPMEIGSGSQLEIYLRFEGGQ